MKRKILSLTLCAAFLSTALCTGVQATGMGEFQRERTYSGQFKDIVGKWYETYIADLYEYGLAQGMGQNTMAPESSVTLAQVIALAARINAKYYDGTIGTAEGEWYEPYISYAIDYGLIERDDAVNVNRPATRRESALIFSRTLPRAQFEAVNPAPEFGDVAVDDPCLDAVTLLGRAGVINGYGAGRFNPDQGISRAEAMTIADRIVSKTMRRGYNEWVQSWNTGGGENSGSSGGNGENGDIGVGVGYGRSTFMLEGVAMITIDQTNSSFTMAVYSGSSGGVVTIAGACEIQEDAGGSITLTCMPTDRAAQGETNMEAALQAAMLEAMSFSYTEGLQLTLSEAVVNGKLVSGKTSLIGALRVGATLTAVS